MDNETMQMQPEDSVLHDEMIREIVPAWAVDIAILFCILQFLTGFMPLILNTAMLNILLHNTSVLIDRLIIIFFCKTLLTSSVFMGGAFIWQWLWGFVSPRTRFVGMLWSATIALAIFLYSMKWMYANEIFHRGFQTGLLALSGIVLCFGSIGILPVLFSFRCKLTNNTSANATCLHVIMGIIVLPCVVAGLLLLNIPGWEVINYIIAVSLVMAVIMQRFSHASLKTAPVQHGAQQEVLHNLASRMLFWCLAGQLIMACLGIFRRLFYNLFIKISSSEVVFQKYYLLSLMLVFVAMLLVAVALGFYSACIYARRRGIYRMIFATIAVMVVSMFIVMLLDVIGGFFYGDDKNLGVLYFYLVESSVLSFVFGATIAAVLAVSYNSYKCSFDNRQALAIASLPVLLFVGFSLFFIEPFSIWSAFSDKELTLSIYRSLVAMFFAVCFFHAMAARRKE